MGAHKHYKHYKEYISAGYPFTTPGSRKTIVDKMPCLRAYAPSGIGTHDPLITSRDHAPLHHSAPIWLLKASRTSYRRVGHSDVETVGTYIVSLRKDVLQSSVTNDKRAT